MTNLKATLIYIVLLIRTSVPVFCQVVAIQNDKQNIFYKGVPNPITVAIENCPSSFIRLTTDNGKISKDENGHYTIKPEKKGVLTINIYKDSSTVSEFIDAKIFRVKEIPLEAHFWGLHEGEISALKVYRGIAPSAIVFGMDMNAMAAIIRFTVIVKRQGVEVFRRQLQDPDGTRFDGITHQFFKTLRTGDKLLIADIVCKDFDNSERSLESIEFTITEEDELKEELKNIGKTRTIVDPVTNEERTIIIED